MKKLIFIISILMCVVAQADPIRVEGSGATRREALNNAFTRAIETYSGTAILSSQEMKNNKLRKNEIQTYSAGYVKKYEIIDAVQTKNNVTVVVDVWINASQMAEHRNSFGSSEKDVDGASLSEQVKSFAAERKQLDNFTNNILADYPAKGLTIETETPTIFMSTSRTATISINARIYWNTKYLISLREMMSMVQDKPEWYDSSCLCWRAREQFQILYPENPKDFFWSSETFYLRDLKLSSAIKETITTPIKIVTRVYDEDKRILYSQCGWLRKNFVNMDKNVLVIGGKTKDYGTTVNIEIGEHSPLYRDIEKIDSIELTLSKSCPSGT